MEIDFMKMLSRVNRPLIEIMNETLESSMTKIGSSGWKKRSLSRAEWDRRLNAWQKNKGIIEDELGVCDESL